MLVNEGMTPITYLAARAALLPYFPGLKTTFFDMQISTDEHHAVELYRAVAELQRSALDDVHFGVMLTPPDGQLSVGDNSEFLKTACFAGFLGGVDGSPRTAFSA